MQGHADFPLSDLGLQQAHVLANRLASMKIDALYASPLLRAKQTADAVAKVLQLDVVEDDRLQEYDFGDISGLTWPEIRDQYPDVAREYQEESGFPKFPGAEGRDAFSARVRESLDEIVASHKDDAAVAVVTHGGPILVYVMSTLGTEYSRPPRFRVDNTSIATIDFGERAGTPARTVIGLNDTCHLRSLTT